MKKQKIKYDGFLLESKMQNIILQVDGVENFGFNVKDKYTSFEWDSIFEYKGNTVVMEFDSHFHYQNPKTIVNDIYKNMECEDRGWKIYRIPYFVQLTQDTTSIFTPFENTEITTDYKHGFVKSKKYPAGYCHLGMERFEKEFKKLPKKVKEDISINLYEACYKYHCSDMVVPSWFFKKYFYKYEK